MSGIAVMTKPPTKCTTWDDYQPFRVWAKSEIRNGWPCVACFAYLQSALEYIAECQDGGVEVIYQSPAHTNPVLPTDARVVWKPAK